MKKTFFTLCMLLAAYSIQAQSFKAAEVEAVDKQFDEGLLRPDLNVTFKHVADDAIFYGTDPTDKWTAATFRKMLERNIADRRPTPITVSRTITPVAAGTMAIVTKQVNWSIFKTPLREVAVYEKKNGWQLKYFSLNILLPDERIHELNQIPTKK